MKTVTRRLLCRHTAHDHQSQVILDVGIALRDAGTSLRNWQAMLTMCHHHALWLMYVCEGIIVRQLQPCQTLLPWSHALKRRSLTRLLKHAVSKTPAASCTSLTRPGPLALSVRIVHFLQLAQAVAAGRPLLRPAP